MTQATRLKNQRVPGEIMEDQAPIRPTPERHRHDEITEPPIDRDNPKGRPARVETQTQIDRYERRKSISPEHAEAARVYFRDAYYAGRISPVSSLIGERLDRSAEAFSDRYVAAYARRGHALRALGPLSKIADHVIIEDHSAEAYAIKRSEHPRFGIVLLREALEALHKHYEGR